MKLFNVSLFGGREGEVILHGEGLAPGVGFGTVIHVVSKHNDAPVVRIKPDGVEREYERVLRAMDRVSEDLESVCLEVEKTMDLHTASIFRAQQIMLSDESVRASLLRELETALVNGEEAARRVFGQYEERLRNAGNETAAARSDDVADISRRVQMRMKGNAVSFGTRVPPGSVVAAERLYPSDTAVLPRNGVEGLVVEYGSKGSHLALLAAGMGVPLVSGIRGVLHALPEGERVIVDGDKGKVYINPSAETLAAFKRRIFQGKEVQSRERWLRNVPVFTARGREIRILANVGSPDDTKVALEYGASGIGLFRLENLYLSRKTFPSESELTRAVLDTVRPFENRPVVVRLLDIGGDKRLPYLDLPGEANPFLGRRGVRLLLHYKDLLVSELKALIEVHKTVPLGIMIPFVTLPEEVVKIRSLAADLCGELGVERSPQIGAMIEIPAAALQAREIARVSDFLSIGTNDLTQYACAADRDNPLVAEYFLKRHPAVMNLVRTVVEQVADKPVSVCGEIAGDVDAIEDLLATGITTLSVAPPLIPHVKDRIRGLHV